MSTTTPVTSVNGADYFGVTANQKKKNLDMQAFLELLVAQLQHQNPLEPMGDRDFFAQMAQLGTVQGLDKMQRSIDVAQASSLMGKTVTGFQTMTENANAINEMVVGKVERLKVQNGEYVLSLRAENGGLVDVKLSNVREVAG
jgi:flagellar basal-body rod modification protein FlgD